jgi:hypothetical protein
MTFALATTWRPRCALQPSNAVEASKPRMFAARFASVGRPEYLILQASAV